MAQPVVSLPLLLLTLPLPRICSSPAVDATPTSPTSATVAITPPPAADGPWPSYKVTACPVGGGACITTTCTTPASCPLTGLTPGTTYAVTAQGVRPDGTTSPPSDEDIITTPSSLGVKLTIAEATGATTGLATATPLPGDTFAQYTFTATPVNGSGPAVTVVSPSPEARFRDLLPNTQARRWCRARGYVCEALVPGLGLCSVGQWLFAAASLAALRRPNIHMLLLHPSCLLACSTTSPWLAAWPMAPSRPCQTPCRL